LGPVLAEIYLRTALNSYLPPPAGVDGAQIYAACMIFGGAYGLIAWKIGRWI
jgi:hypothetical protein